MSAPDRNQSEGNQDERDAFQYSNSRLGARLSMQRIRYCNFLHLSVFQKVLLAILLTTVAICVGVFVREINSNANSTETGSFLHSDKTFLNDTCQHSNPCLNGGACVNQISSNSCACSKGFSGSVCEFSNKFRYPGTCATPSDAGNCPRCRVGFVKDPKDDAGYKYANENASLLISLDTGVRMIYLDIRKTTQTILKEAKGVRGTDYNFRTNTIFWFGQTDKTINTCPINSESGKHSIMQDPSSDILGLAVDWIHDNIYWIDNEKDELCVTNFQGTMKKVLFNDALDWPTSIAVNPLNGLMYWTDGGAGVYRIERAGLDGSRREVILSTNTRLPQGLVIDFVDSRLYWSQGYNPSSIWSSNFDGSDRKFIFIANSRFSSSSFYKIATYDKYVYFNENYSYTINRVNKCNGGDLSLVYKYDSWLGDIKIYDASMQPEGCNLCLTRIGHCSHFCFPVPTQGNGTVSTTTCACPDGLKLSADHQNCI